MICSDSHVPVTFWMKMNRNFQQKKSWSGTILIEKWACFPEEESVDRRRIDRVQKKICVGVIVVMLINFSACGRVIESDSSLKEETEAITDEVLWYDITMTEEYPVLYLDEWRESDWYPELSMQD